MRQYFIFWLLLLTYSVQGQKISVGASITPAFGNITYKQSKNVYVNYAPAFSLGGGLELNYYKKRWILNSGIVFKNDAGKQKIQLTNDIGVWEGKYIYIRNVLPVIAVPVGIHYAIIHHFNFKLYAGLRIENGWLVNQNRIIRGDNFKSAVKMDGKYYLGIKPGVRIEYGLTERKFLYSNTGVCYQFTHYESWDYPYFEPTVYRINNLFIDIGLGFRIKD